MVRQTFRVRIENYIIKRSVIKYYRWFLYIDTYLIFYLDTHNICIYFLITLSDIDLVSRSTCFKKLTP